MIGSRRIAIVLVAALLVAALPVAAQSTDRATAEALFREAKRLMAKRNFAEACPKLAESQKLDPQGGTLLNLAVCHAREGKTASAWSEFQEALALAREAKRNDRILLAKRELAKLSPRLSHLIIEVPESARVKGLEVRRDDTAMGEATFGVAIPVDPGEFAISAKAPGFEPWQTTVTVDEAQRSSVTVPRLTPLPPPPPKPKKPPEPKPSESADDGSSQRLAGYVVGGAGLIALGVGGYFGIRAVSKASESDDHCNGNLCDPRGLELNDEADTAATISNVAVGIGIVGVGVGTYLLVTAPAEKEPGKSAGASVVVGARSAGILFSGAW